MIAKIGCGDICIGEDTLTFENNYKSYMSIIADIYLGGYVNNGSHQKICPIYIVLYPVM